MVTMAGVTAVMTAHITTISMAIQTLMEITRVVVMQMALMIIAARQTSTMPSTNMTSTTSATVVMITDVLLADSHACVCVSAYVFVNTIFDCGASGFARVFVLCRVAKFSCVAFNWSRRRRASHAFTCVARSWASRAFF